MNQQNFTWSFIENQEKPRNRFWVAGMVVFFGASAAIAFVLGNYLFGVIIAIGGLVLIGSGLRSKQTVEVIINERGVVIDQELLTFSEIKNFWLTSINHPENKPYLLYLQPKKNFQANLSLPIDDSIDLINLRLFLQEKCTEKEINGPFLHHLIDRIGI